jgi:pimeloyl-ACP methyl ester carboxylesterase
VRAGRAAALLVVALLALAGCGDEAGGPARSGPPPVERFTVGEGARGATVLRERGAPAGRPVVVFLHGWSAVRPEAYGAWLEHLVRGGATVVYPIYQTSLVDVRSPLPNLLAALRAAFARLDGHGPVVAAGHSAGGALAVDLAASAARAGLPAPQAVLSVFPGRGLRGIPLRLPAADPTGVPPSTRLLVLASERDEVVGTGTARNLVARAVRVPRARRTLRLVRDRAAADHGAPQRDDAAARRTFWAPLDRLVQRVAR